MSPSAHGSTNKRVSNSLRESYHIIIIYVVPGSTTQWPPIHDSLLTNSKRYEEADVVGSLKRQICFSALSVTALQKSVDSD